MTAEGNATSISRHVGDARHTPRAMALAEWLRAGRDEALFAPSWDVWWSDYEYAESQGFNNFTVGVGAFEDFDDHVLLGYEDMRAWWGPMHRATRTSPIPLTSPFKRFTLRLMYTRVLLIIMPFLLARSLVLLRINRSRRRGLQSSLPA